MTFKSHVSYADWKPQSHCLLGKYIISPATKTIINYKCGPMPNVMVALPNIGGALCSITQSLANAHY